MNVPNSTTATWTNLNTATWSARDFFPDTISEYLDISVRLFTPSVTSSVHYYETIEPELTPYECSLSSGVLNFWGDKSEDIYTSEDGLPL